MHANGFYRMLLACLISLKMPMGNRLTKIVTRTGDDGTTGLGDGSRTHKGSARIQAIGDVDELNSNLGLLLSESLAIYIREQLLQVQHDLFSLGGELSIPGHRVITQDQVFRLDRLIEDFNTGLAPLKEFILPGGSRAAAQAHVCRSVCRRAERSLVNLKDDEASGVAAKQYLNRLSDWLFVLARVLNQQAASDEEYWQQLPKEKHR